MRRVLFGTGFPQVVPFVDPIANPDACLQILELRDLTAENKSRTRFLTLFAWTLGGPSSIANIYVQVGAQAPYLVGSMIASNDETITNSFSIKFAIRGDVRVIAASTLADGCAVFGYFELEDTIPSMEIVRPLQPSSPVSPFTVVPLSLIASDISTLHAFEEDYTDIVNIDYTVFQTVPGVGMVSFTFPNGVSLFTKEQGVANGQINIMPGIPMLPSAAGQVITVTADADIDSAVISGTFIRV